MRPHENPPSSSSTKRLWQLEALRGFAAFYLLLHHISSSYLKLKHTAWGFPFRFGQEGVLIFFLLSGFVICHSQQNSDGLRNYFIKRSRRIYPIFLLAIFLSYSITCHNIHGLAPARWPQLFGNLFMLQDHPERPGYFFLPYGDNMPLWSLSFEWWFYLLFYPINRWLRRAAQKFLVCGLSVAAMLVNQFYPNGACWFIIFFPIWWTGVELANEFAATGTVTMQGQKTMLALLGVPLLWYSSVTTRWWLAGAHLDFISYPFVQFRYFLMTYVCLGVLFAWQRIQFIGFTQTIGWFYPLGSISYALYLFHYPILMDLRFFVGENFFYADLLLRLVLTFFIAWMAEGLFQKWINRRTNPWLNK